jgi:hypothetical protein
MKSFLISLILALICLTGSSQAFSPVRPSSSVGVAPSVTSSTSLNVFGNRKTKEQQPEEDDKYWGGEWVCKDCGYIYNRVCTSPGVDGEL